jgi:hypothetical protein
MEQRVCFLYCQFYLTSFLASLIFPATDTVLEFLPQRQAERGFATDEVSFLLLFIMGT